MGSGGSGAVMDIESIHDAIEWQAGHAEQNGAPGTARIIRAFPKVMETETATGRRIAGWQGLTLKDAMPLRLTGGMHNLLLTGTDRRLEPVYAGLTTDQAAVDAIVVDLVETYDTRLLPWLDGPPQTNEAGRSASIMAGFMWLCGKLGNRFDLFEIGSSAGINTMMERYHYDLGGVEVGPADSPMRIAPEWRGGPPPDAAPKIESIRGCDLAPIDLTDAEAALRLKSYVWPEATARMGRIDAAIELANRQRPDVVQQPADEFVASVLGAPARKGVTRVLFHSIVWQYIPDDAQVRINAAMEEAGAAATSNTPLAWVSLETNRETFAHELRVRFWPGGEEELHLATAHPHGAWVEWLA